MHMFANYNFKSLVLSVYISTSYISVYICPSLERFQLICGLQKNLTASLTLHPKMLKCSLFLLKIHFCLKRVDRNVCEV